VRIEARVFDSAETLHAPHLIDVEVGQALRRLDALADPRETWGEKALSVLGAMPLRRYPHGLLMSRAWQMRHNLTMCDAMYAALAELLDATLLTRDRRLAAAPLHRARVEVI
jgi:predicted nucleic acid-binding protein